MPEASSQSQVPLPAAPPVAPRISSVRALHGSSESDDYAWMRDHERPELRDYLAAERGYYDAHAALLSALAGRLAAESAGRIPDQAEDSVGWPLSGFIYRTRTPQGRENLQFLRSQSGESAEQVLLDENIIGAATGYVDVGAREPSPDGSLLAWSADTNGAEIYRLRIRDLRTGADLPDDIERSYPGVAWSADSRYVFYLVPDELNRPYQLWRHEVGTPASGDVLVLQRGGRQVRTDLARLSQRPVRDHHLSLQGHHRGRADPASRSARRARRHGAATARRRVLGRSRQVR